MESSKNRQAIQKKPRHRSPNYPTVGLREAVDRVKKLYEADGKAGAPDKVAVLHIGFTSAHGQAFSTLAALKKFGLVESLKGKIVPTQRATEIIQLPDSDPRRIQALRDAALSPAIYRETIEQYSETGLPSNEALKSELITYKAFNPNAVAGFVKDFRDSLDFAGLSNVSEIKFEGEPNNGEKETPEILYNPKGDKVPSLVNAWILSPRVSAELRINGDVSSEDLELLRDYVEITIKALNRKANQKQGE